MEYDIITTSSKYILLMSPYRSPVGFLKSISRGGFERTYCIIIMGQREYSLPKERIFNIFFQYFYKSVTQAKQHPY